MGLNLLRGVRFDPFTHIFPEFYTEWGLEPHEPTADPPLVTEQTGLGKQYRPRSDCSLNQTLLKEQSDQGLHCLPFHLLLYGKTTLFKF